MRAFLDAILAAIDASSLTDDEFAYEEVAALTVQDYSETTYTAVLAVLDAREVVSTDRDRLKGYFASKGTFVEQSSAARTEIFLGAGLCD